MRRSTHRSGSNRNGRPGQGGGEPTAAGATTTGGPVRAVVNPPQREQPQQEARCKGRARKFRAAVNPPQQEQPQPEARCKGRSPQRAQEPMWRGYKAPGLTPLLVCHRERH